MYNKFKHGAIVKDTRTGFIGSITCISIYLGDFIYCGVLCKSLNSTHEEYAWFDSARLIIIK